MRLEPMVYPALGGAVGAGGGVRTRATGLRSATASNRRAATESDRAQPPPDDEIRMPAV